VDGRRSLWLDGRISELVSGWERTNDCVNEKIRESVCES
jgi:hypothetical protein